MEESPEKRCQARSSASGLAPFFGNFSSMTLQDAIALILRNTDCHLRLTCGTLAGYVLIRARGCDRNGRREPAGLLGARVLGWAGVGAGRGGGADGGGLCQAGHTHWRAGARPGGALGV